MKNKILVTGSTGNVGSEVIKYLGQTNAHIKAAIFDSKSVTKVDRDIETVVFDFEKPETFADALDEVEKVFLMRPPQMGDPKQLYPFIDAAKASGVKQMVFLSLLGVQNNPLAPHGYIEKHIIKSTIPYTLLRPSFFMQNLSTTHCKDIRECNEIIVPAGRGKTSFVDVRDIAAVAAKVMTEHGHENKAYDLTGSEALDYYQVSEIISRATGKKIVYTNPSSRVFGKRMAGEGSAKEFITVMKGIYPVAKLGLAGKVTSETEKILGRKPISFEQFAKDNKDLFNGETTKK